MWHRKNNNCYKVPPKPKTQKEQTSMLWDAVYNHIPSILRQQDRRLKWQDVKLTFVLIFMALILASLATKLF